QRYTSEGKSVNVFASCDFVLLDSRLLPIIPSADSEIPILSVISPSTSKMTPMIDTVATVERNDLSPSESNSGSGRSYGYLRLRLDQRIPVLPGQFAMLKPHGICEPLLRRAMAYYRSAIVGGALCVDFIYQILGRGTQSLANLKPGDQVDFL